MYINFKLLSSREVSPLELMLLIACRQNQSGESAQVIKEYYHETPGLESMEQRGYIEYIKGKKGQEPWDKIRLSKRGKDFLEDIETPEVTADDLKVYEWLEAIYKNSERIIGNRKKTKMYIACFRAQSSIEKNRLAYLCQCFINDSDNMEYNLKLEFMFFKPDNVYSTRFDLEQSRLYKYYLKHQEYFDKEFEKL